MIQEMTEIYDRSEQLWTNIEEDDKLKELENKKERVNTAMQELKQRKKK